jgi:hypothetical protein
VEFGAGMIKWRGDRCWRELRCMDYHHETQPMPNPLSWAFHRLPRWVHRVESMGNWVAQLVLPFGLFLPQPFATVAAVLMIGSQLYLVVSGNYAWLNWATIVVMTAAIADPVLQAVVPNLATVPPEAFTAAPAWFTLAVIALTIVVAVLSINPVRNLLSPRQAMNASFNSLHLVNTYGAFGSVTRRRYEVIVEGSAAESPTESDWLEYEFKARPGPVRRLAPQVAPYHLRLDWLMWFIPLSPRYAQGWFLKLLMRLLEADRPTLRLLRRSPFGDERPRWVRARLFHYRFSTWRQLRETGAWWQRTFAEDLVPPLRLRSTT